MLGGNIIEQVLRTVNSCSMPNGWNDKASAMILNALTGEDNPI